MEKFICIHGHFYQPPRENPWLEAVELQDSASPYHDWNERITAESYAPNATARIHDGEGRIERIVNNYSRISFNFGPTLLAWMKEKLPEIHGAIVAADKQSREIYSGHGSAMAQVYNHMILPLANTRDKYTQVIWGIRDFEFRFGRPPEGMWLSETAADIPSLEVLAERGIKFTILSPFQASRMREIGGRNWKDVNGARIDPTRPYRIKLPSGRTIAAFFYDAPVSQAVAFEKLLSSGERFAERLMSAFSDKRQRDQLVHIATDGESYGHHHRYGEMALAYALKYIDQNKLARLTNYGEYLETHPPTHEIQIHDKSAWSCSHGVRRWMDNCGCNSGGHGGWNQMWRQPLRMALDWLRDTITPLFENKAKDFLKSPWDARNDYIQVILDRSPENVDKFFSAHESRTLSEEERICVLKLMEMQRHAMLMYTSCGWFFDELSGIETVQVIQYAGRVIQLAMDVFGQDLETGFVERLEYAKSNIPEHRDGKLIYQKFVKPAMVDWEKVVAHYAISSLFNPYPEKPRIYLYTFDEEEKHSYAVGKAKLAVGKTRVTFQITRETAVLTYAVMYMGEHNLVGGVRKYLGQDEYCSMLQQIKESFEHADFPETIRLIDRHFGNTSYSLKSLFKDEQRHILDQILSTTHEDLENRYRLIVERYAPLMRFLQDLGAPLPEALETAADFILHSDILRQLESDRTDVERLRALVAEAKSRNVNICDAKMSYVIKQRLESMIQKLADQPEDLELLKSLEGLAEIVKPLPLGLNLWKVQNTYFEMMQSIVSGFREKALAGDPQARTWLQLFTGLGYQLDFAVKQLQNETQSLPQAA